MIRKKQNSGAFVLELYRGSDSAKKDVEVAPSVCLAVLHYPRNIIVLEEMSPMWAS